MRNRMCRCVHGIYPTELVYRARVYYGAYVCTVRLIREWKTVEDEMCAEYASILHAECNTGWWWMYLHRIIRSV